MPVPSGITCSPFVLALGFKTYTNGRSVPYIDWASVDSGTELTTSRGNTGNP